LDRLASRAHRAAADWEGRWLTRWSRALRGTEADKKLAGAKLDRWHSVGPFPVAPGTKPLATSFAPERERLDFDKSFENGKLRWKPVEGLRDGRLEGVDTTPGGVTYLARTMDVASPRTVRLALVSDRPVSVWLDGKPSAYEATQAHPRLDATAGRHTVLL